MEGESEMRRERLERKRMEISVTREEYSHEDYVEKNMKGR